MRTEAVAAKQVTLGSRAIHAPRVPHAQVWMRRLENTETGALVSIVLACFHASCVAVMLHAMHAKAPDLFPR